MPRDAADYVEASYESDPAEGCDTLENHVEELLHQRFPKAEPGSLKRMSRLFVEVLHQLLADGRVGALVDVKRLTGRELLARLIGEIMDAPKPQLMACCVDFTFGLGVQVGMNETQIAHHHNVTKATVSRYCVHLKQIYLNGQPAQGMKSNTAVESYRQNRLGRSSRPPRSEWAFGNVLKSTYERTA